MKGRIAGVAGAFGLALLESMLEDAGCTEATPEDIFGTTAAGMLDEAPDAQSSAYRPGTPLQMRYKRLAERDPSFAQYLADNAVDLDTMHKLASSERASIVRKVTSVVAVRETFRSEAQLPGGRRVQRSRKNPGLYTGVEALLAIVEGNPRWLIGLMGPLVRRYKEEQRRISRATQASAITTAANRFRALLRTVPYVPEGQSGGRQRQQASRGLLSLLDVLGERFHRHVVVDPFSSEPVLSFTVDANSPAGLLEALGKALNAGAIILVPDAAAEAITSSIKGKRFRLSYMLAPNYGLPLLLGREGSLQRLLIDERNHSAPLFRETP